MYASLYPAQKPPREVSRQVQVFAVFCSKKAQQSRLRERTLECSRIKTRRPGALLEDVLLSYLDSRSSSSRSQRSRGKNSGLKRKRESNKDRSRSKEKDQKKIHRNTSFIDSKTLKDKIVNRIILPNYLIPYLIENGGKKMNKIVEKTDCFLSVHKEVETVEDRMTGM
jgi:hypothetical protein